MNCHFDEIAGLRVEDRARALRLRCMGFGSGWRVGVSGRGRRGKERHPAEDFDLHTRDDAVRMTRRERILTWDLPAEDEAVLRAQVAELEQLAVHGDPAAIRRALVAVVPEYRPEPDGGAGR